MVVCNLQICCPLTNPALLAGTWVRFDYIRRIDADVQTQDQGNAPGLHLGGGRERITEQQENKMISLSLQQNDNDVIVWYLK